MNVAAHQEKKENENTGKRKEKTNGRFLRGHVLPFCGRLEGSTAKNGLCEGSAQGNWYPREDQQPFRLNPNEVGDHVEVAVSWCS